MVVGGWWAVVKALEPSWDHLGTLLGPVGALVGARKGPGHARDGAMEATRQVLHGSLIFNIVYSFFGLP